MLVLVKPDHEVLDLSAGEVGSRVVASPVAPAGSGRWGGLMVEYFELTFDLESVASAQTSSFRRPNREDLRLLLLLDHDEDTNPFKPRTLRRSRRSSAHVRCVALIIFNDSLMVI